MSIFSPKKGVDGKEVSTSERNQLVGESVLALAVVLVAIKLGKALAEFYFDNPPAALRDIRASWLLRIAAATTVVFVVTRRYWPRWKWIFSLLPFALLVPAKVIQALLRRSPEMAYVWFPEMVGQFRNLLLLTAYLLRRDVIFLASFAIIVSVASRFTPARYFRFLKIATRACIVALLLISGIELASYCKIGVAGTGHLLAYFLTNAASLWPMLKPEIGITSMVALLSPLLVGVAAMVWVQRWYARLGIEPSRSLARAWPILGAILLLAVIFRAPRMDHRFDRFVDNTYLALDDLFPWGRSGQIEAVKEADQMPVLFDTSGATIRAGKNEAGNRKNVIIIMLESARASATSIANPKLDSTPFLAAFASRSAAVPDMYAVIPRTSAAWVAILDGIWPSTDEEMGAWSLNGERQTSSLPKLLATRGYSSAYFTSAHLNFGYDDELIKNEQFGAVFDADNLPSQGFQHPTFWGFEDRIMVAPSLAWVQQQRDRQNPFLLVMMTNIGHFDYEYPSTWKARSFGTGNPSYERYLNCMSYVDSVLKEFMDGLDRMGVLRSSIVIILGDHGESFGEHGPTAHSLELYDETLRIPAIIHADGLVRPGTAISGLRQEVDVMPTVLDALDMKAENATISGSSMLQPIPPDRPLYFSGALYSQATAMRKGGTKYIYNFGRIPVEAYAIDRDPSEQHDIAGTLPHAEIEKAEMDMLVWRERVSRAYRAQGERGAAVHSQAHAAAPMLPAR